jgi:hypothetical protein
MEDDEDRRDAIERIEAQIDELAAKVESCRKFIVVGRLAVAGGAILLVALLLGVVTFDPRLLLAALTALLAGIVVWGSNRSTAHEAAAELAEAEAERTALIGALELHPVAERGALH